MPSEKEKVPHPHDSGFKNAIHDLRVAREFFINYLPEHVQKRIRLDTLELQNSAFIDRELHPTASDVLYRVNLSDKTASSAFLYVLIEQQSQPDRWLPFRMLGYVVQIIEQYRKQMADKKQVLDTLPLVFPLIFYTGKDAYTYPLNTPALFDDPELATAMLVNDCRFIDLKTLDDSVLLSHQWTGLLEIFMKHAKTRDAVNLLQDTLQLIKSLLRVDANNYVSSMLKYLISEGEVEDVNHFMALLRRQVIEPFPEMGDTVMTIAEQLEQRGVQQGIRQGIQKNIEQVALRMHRAKVSEETILLATNLKTAELHEILKKVGNKH